MTNTSDGICRVCESTDDLEMIFEEVNAEILEMLQAASDSEIRADDGFPKHVCIACIFSLEDFYQFKSLYESTYRKWKRLTNGSGQIKESAGKTIDPEVGTNAKIRFHTPEEANEIFFNSQVVDDQSGSSDSVRDGIEKQAATYVMNGKESVASSYRNAVQDQQQNSENPPDVNIIAREQLPSTDKDNANEKRNTYGKLNYVNNKEIDYLRGNRSKSNSGDESHISEDGSVTTEDATIMKPQKAVRCEMSLENCESIHPDSNCYKCEICGELFCGLHTLNAHIALHKNSEMFKCDICDKTFTKENGLKEHTFSHSVLNKCSECGKSFSTSRYSNAHIALHKNSDLYTCDCCEKTFKNETRLKDHKISHSSVQQCNECSKSFKTMRTLRLHMALHENPDCFKCDECDKPFKSPQSLRKHKFDIHSTKNGYQCTECGKSFTGLQSFEIHLALHLNPNLYACEICEASFTRVGMLNMHKKWHLNPEQYKCEKCGKFLKSAQSLKRHKISHSDLYKCDKCGQSFSVLRYLEEHLALHKNPDLYKCGICGKAFNYVSNLKRHLVLHSNPDICKCHKCGKSFATERSLRAHEITHM